MSKFRVTEQPGEDVFDLPDEDREQLRDDFSSRDTFQAVGIDDYTSVDKVILRNGSSYFITEPA